MPTAPLVSVLMTAYNRERYIAASIDSVLAQTFGDFELLVVDDRSTDATPDVARSYARRDPRVRVVVNDRNLGDYGNRNHAARLARGTLLKYHDSDDLMYRHCLATMAAPMVAYPEAAFGLSSGRYWPGGPCPMMLTPRLAYQREFLGSSMFNAGPAGAIFRAETFRALGGFPDAGPASDYVFWLHACARVPVLLLPADTFWYREHAEQEIRRPAAALRYAQSVRDTWAALAAPECPLTADEREQARRNVLWTHLKAIRRDLRARRFALARGRLVAGPTPAEWLRYLRRPRRDRLAGTPRDAQGDYVLPRELPMPDPGPRT
jgi:hypothetical protein